MLYTKDNINFKKVNKNLKSELEKMGFSISNQSCLNLLSRSLGFANYNTYKNFTDGAPDVIEVLKECKNATKETSDSIKDTKNILDLIIKYRADAISWGWSSEHAQALAEYSYEVNVPSKDFIIDSEAYSNNLLRAKAAMLFVSHILAIKDSDIDYLKARMEEINFENYIDYHAMIVPEDNAMKHYISMVKKGIYYDDRLIHMLLIDGIVFENEVLKKRYRTTKEKK